jgi:methionyl-tRNA synthetase
MNLARAGNKYFNDSEPWKTVKSNKEQCGTALNICLQAIYTLCELIAPVLPFTSEKLFKMLNTGTTDWDKCGGENLKEGHMLNKSEILFPKVEDELIEKQMNKFGVDGRTTVEPNETKNDIITIDDFMKVQLRTAEVIEAENVKKSDKLLKLKVRLENEERQVIAGIAKDYTPADILGKKIVLVANLKPAKLMGLESNGMILAVQDESGKFNVLTVNPNVKNGTRAK